MSDNVIHLHPDDFHECEFVVECPSCGSELAEADSMESVRRAAEHIGRENGYRVLAIRPRHSGDPQLVYITESE